jgi:hypothetical protein
METGNRPTVHLSDLTEKADEIDRIITEAKKLSDELIATVSMLNSLVQDQEQEQKDGNGSQRKERAD